MKLIFTIVFCFVVPFAIMAQNTVSDKKISLSIEQKTMPEIIGYISKLSNINFSFTNDIFPDLSQFSYKATNQSLETILNDILLKNGIEWFVYNNNIILRKGKILKIEYRIKGSIIDAQKKTGIPYASIAIIKSGTGVFSNDNGLFELNVTTTSIYDSVEISSIGYFKKHIRIKDLLQTTQNTIELIEHIATIPAVDINARDYKTETTGNDAFIPMGTLYLDTHGQQTALFIENQKGRKGEIANVQFYLSKKGNALAPFRIHIYALDSMGSKPGQDLLTESFVVKPSTQWGWCTVDLSQMHIAIPAHGFFVAIEGVYPSIYTDKHDTTQTEITENDDFDETPSIVSYGQKIGYSKNKKSKNNTWHYSLSHTWFQLRKNNFGVMIAADIRYMKRRKMQRING